MIEQRYLMRNFLLFAILVLGFILSIDANAQFFWGNVNSKDAAVNLTNQIAHQNDLKTIEVGTDDPTSVPISAATGSIYINATGLFQKLDAGSSTNWAAFVDSPVDLTSDVTGVLPVANGGTNSSTALNNGKVIISSGGAIQEASAFLYDDATNIATIQNASITTATVTNFDSTDATITNLTATDSILTNATITTATATNLNSTDAVITNANITTATFNYLDAVTAYVDFLGLPTQSPSSAVITDASGFLQTSSTTSTEISYVNGVTSAIQTQIDSKLATALATGYLFVGDGDQVAQGVPLSGDATIDSTGNLQVSTGVLTNNEISSIAAIDYSKLASLDTSRIALTDASGFLTTSANLTHVAGVTTATGQVNVDNLRLDGNELSTTTGNVTLGVGATGSIGLNFTGNQDYYFSADANNSDNLNIQGQSAGTASSVDFFSGDGTGVANNLRLIGSGLPSDMAANFEALQIGWSSSSSKYRLFSGASGTGTVRDFAIDIGSASNALHVDSATGWVSINGSSPTAELTVNGAIKVNTTTKGSQPYGQGTEAQRDLITASTFDLFANTDTGELNIYTGSAWESFTTIPPVTDVAPVSYNKNDAQSLTDNTFVIINFDDLVSDDDALVTTGTGWNYESPSDQWVRATARVKIDATATQYIARMAIYKNGSYVADMDYKGGKDTTTASAVLSIGGSYEIELSTTDTIDIRVLQDAGVANTLVPASGDNWVTITPL